MKFGRVFAVVFLAVLLFSTFFALSVHVLQIEFCGMPMARSGRLCDVLSGLSAHNYFAAALAGIAAGIGIALVSFRSAKRAALHAPRLCPLAGASRLTPHASRLAPHTLYWLARHVNSPNGALARR